MYTLFFLLGIALVPLGAPKWLVVAAEVLPLLGLIAAGFTAAWSKGHSGLVVIPLKSGPFGFRGLSIEAGLLREYIAYGSLVLLAGILIGLGLAERLL